jgi:LacI family transcriptional regulator
MSEHDAISQVLRAQIASGRYDGAGNLPSETQPAERFGVSRPTVAKALRDLQVEGLLERRAGSGTFVRPRGRGESSARVLVLPVPERGTTETFEAICGELGALARANEFGVLWGDYPLPRADRASTPEHAAEVCRQFIDKAVTGVFFAPMEYSAKRDQLPVYYSCQ